jgi:replicative DNA helicase
MKEVELKVLEKVELPRIEGIVSIEEAVEQNIKYVNAIRDGSIPVLKTPWSQLNNMYIKGYEPGSVVTFGGHSGTGKTALMCQMAVEMCLLNENVRVLCISLETLARSIAIRMQSYIQKVSKREFLTGEQEIDLEKAKMLSKLPIDIYEVGLNYNKLRALMYQYSEDHPNKTIIFMLDHSLLVDGSHKEDDKSVMRRVFKVVLEVKMALPRNLYVIFSQLNDSVKTDARTDPKFPARHFPRYTDVYEGRKLWHVSDSVIIMNNPSSNYMDIYGTDAYPTEGYIFFHVCKSRDADIETFPLINELQWSTLRELTEEELDKFKAESKKNRKQYGFK